MARIRTIKPEFWTSEQIVECSPTERLLFIGLWNFCDDAGRHPFSPKKIKMEIFPADEFSLDDISTMLRRLIAENLLTAYVFEDKHYLQVTGWHHQKIERPNFKYPPIKGGKPGDISKIVRRTLDDQSPPEGSLKEGKGVEEVSDSSLRSESGGKPPNGILDDTALYRRGKEVLGQNAGGQITKLKQHFRGDVGQTRLAIEKAAEKENPAEYVAGILKNASPGKFIPGTTI